MMYLFLPIRKTLIKYKKTHLDTDISLYMNIIHLFYFSTICNVGEEITLP